MSISMDSRSSHPSDIPKPKRLRTLASDVKFTKGNTLLHQFVLDNSDPNQSGSGNYINAVLLSMSDAPVTVVNALNEEGYSALHLAASKNNLLMVEKLLSCLADIDVNARSVRGSTALYLAALKGHLSVVKVLLDEGAIIDIDNGIDGTALCAAASAGRLGLMKLLASKGSNLNHRGKWGTPLSCAAESGNLEAVEFLLSSGAEVNLRNEWNPLCSAVVEEKLDIVEFLLSKGADVNIEDKENETPLHLAAKSYSLELVEYLLRNGADVNAENGGIGETPLHHAVRGSKIEYMGFSIDLAHYAVDIVEHLLDQGADINAENFENETPLHYAVRERNLVLEHFSEISSVWERHDAVRQGNLEIVKLLIDQGADLRSIDEEGRTPLHGAVDEECSKIAEFLADRGEGPHANRGWNPYHDAEYRCCAKIIRTLLDRGADVNVENEKGETPIDLARNQPCIDALQKLEQEYTGRR